MSETYRYKMPIQGVMYLLRGMKENVLERRCFWTELYQQLKLNYSDSTCKRLSLLTQSNEPHIGYIGETSTKQYKDVYETIKAICKEKYSDPKGKKLGSIFITEMNRIRDSALFGDLDSSDWWICRKYFSEENIQYYSDIILTEGPDRAFDLMLTEAFEVGRRPKGEREIRVDFEEINHDNPLPSDPAVFLRDTDAVQLFISQINKGTYAAPSDDPLQKFRKDAYPVANHTSGYKELVRLSPEHCYGLSGDCRDIVEIRHISEDAPMKGCILSMFDDKNEGVLFFNEKKNEFMAFLDSREHPYQPSLLWLYNIKDEQRKDHMALLLTFGVTGDDGYCEHHIYLNRYYELRSQNKVINDVFDDIVTDSRPNLPFNRTHPAWARCGQGIWLITSDGYLVCSSLDSYGGDVANTVSYSTGGNLYAVLNTADGPVPNDPFRGCVRAVKEKLNIEITPEELKLFNVGIDLTGHWVQFSFYTTIPLRADELVVKNQVAYNRGAEKLIFVPFEHDSLNALCSCRNLQASAKYTLGLLASSIDEING